MVQLCQLLIFFAQFHHIDKVIVLFKILSNDHHSIDSDFPLVFNHFERFVIFVFSLLWTLWQSWRTEWFLTSSLYTRFYKYNPNFCIKILKKWEWTKIRNKRIFFQLQSTNLWFISTIHWKYTETLFLEMFNYYLCRKDWFKNIVGPD